MKLFYLLPFCLGLSSISLIIPHKSLSLTPIAQLEDITNITTSVLDKLGYECETVSAAAMICRKCSDNSSITEKCTVYICDTATKKCRKQNANVPKLPNSIKDRDKDRDKDRNKKEIEVSSITYP